jgi:hypothetical protein
LQAHVKIGAHLLHQVRADLRRRHAFAAERVGFLFAGVAWSESGIVLLCRDYMPVADEDYVDDPRVGAMMGESAIRKALQHAMQTRSAALHVHEHGHRGRPGFSGIDIRENAKFVPDFFKVAPFVPHGALVLSQDSAAGQFWERRSGAASPITRFSSVGAALGLEGVLP